MAILFAPEVQMELPFDELHKGGLPLTDELRFTILRGVRQEYAGPIRRLSAKVFRQAIGECNLGDRVRVAGSDPLHILASVIRVPYPEEDTWGIQLHLPLLIRSVEGGILRVLVERLIKKVSFLQARPSGEDIVVPLVFDEFVHWKFREEEGGIERSVYALRDEVSSLCAHAQERRIPFRLVKEGVAA